MQRAGDSGWDMYSACGWWVVGGGLRSAWWSALSAQPFRLSPFAPLPPRIHSLPLTGIIRDYALADHTTKYKRMAAIDQVAIRQDKEAWEALTKGAATLSRPLLNILWSDKVTATKCNGYACNGCGCNIGQGVRVAK